MNDLKISKKLDMTSAISLVLSMDCAETSFLTRPNIASVLSTRAKVLAEHLLAGHESILMFNESSTTGFVRLYKTRTTKKKTEFKIAYQLRSTVSAEEQPNTTIQKDFLREIEEKLSKSNLCFSSSFIQWVLCTHDTLVMSAVDSGLLADLAYIGSIKKLSETQVVFRPNSIFSKETCEKMSNSLSSE